MEGSRSLLDSRKGEGREGNRDSGGEERKRNHDQLLRHRLSEFQLKCRFIYGSPKKIMMALFFCLFLTFLVKEKCGEIVVVLKINQERLSSLCSMTE